MSGAAIGPMAATAARQARWAALTARNDEIKRLRDHGLDDVEISQRVGISVHTVRVIAGRWE